MDVFKKLNYIFERKQKWESIGIFVLIMIGTVFELLGVSTIQPLVNTIMYSDRILEEEPYRRIYNMLHLTSVNQLILVIIGGLIVLYLVKNAYLIFMYNRQYKYIYSNMRELSTRMMHSYLERPYSYHVNKSSSELLRNINQDTADFFGVIQALVQLLTEGMVVLVLITYLFIEDKSITMAVGVMLGIVMYIFMRIYKKSLLQMGQKNRFYEAQVTKWVQQAFGGIKEVKVMNKEDFFYNEYDKAFQGRVRSEYTYHTMITLPKPMIEAVCMVSLLSAAAFKIIIGVNPLYFIPTLSIFVVSAYRLLPSFNRITEYMGTIAYQKPAVSAIYSDLKEIAEFQVKKNTFTENPQPLPFREKISISNVSFKYPDSGKMVLNHVNFSIEKNTSVAFIGLSGAGKSTLADIVLGVLKPTEGCIMADQTDVSLHLDAWHKTIGYIPQNIYLMDDTIAANIAFGVGKDQIDHHKLQMAIERSQLIKVIADLPQGVDTKVGERGVRLSGGQRQRIGIARALYNEPQILVLDEATSALDNKTEQAVMESIDALHGEMTLVIIAHRLSTIKNCDKVYEIVDGNAVLQKEEHE